MLSRKSLKILVYIIKGFIAVLTLWFVVDKLFVDQDYPGLMSAYKGLDFSTIGWGIPLLLLLTIGNWGSETIKWRILIAKKEIISWGLAVKAVLSGITISMLTPNRIGEYIGRVWYLDKADKIQSSLITIIGSISQLVINIIFGTICFVIYIYRNTNADSFTMYLLCATVALLAALSLIFYFNIYLVSRIFHKFKSLNRFIKYSDVFAEYDNKDLGIVLLFSFIRYLIYCSQYVLLLLFFGIEISWIEGVSVVSVIFLVQTILPSFTLAELGIRGITATYFLSSYSDNKIGILLSAYTLLIVNIIIPALLGLFFIITNRFLKW